MTKKLIVILLGVAVLVGLAALVKANQHSTTTSSKVKVTASFYPMAEFARQVGGDKVDVSTMVKPGVEPHDYDPAPGDLTNLYKSKLFVYNGAGLEKWVSRVQADLKSNHVTPVDASAGIPVKAGGPGSTDAGVPDPHVWLDPILASRQVTNIEAALAQADPANAAYYHDRAAQYKGQLAKLHEAFTAGLAQCGRRDIVTSHQAFGYLGSRYHLDILPISGLSPDEEPTPQKLAEIAKFAQAHNVKYIFFETLVSPKLSQTIAKEIGAQTLAFNPLEGLTDSQLKNGANYLTVQQDNLKNLRIALDCK